MSSDLTDRLPRILADLSLIGPFAQAEYVQTMESKWGKNADRYMDAVDRVVEIGGTAEAWRRLYQLKNADWQMSAYSSAHDSTTKCRAFLEWLAEHSGDTPKQIVDLGCDVGLLTLAMAKLFPESAVLGIDCVGSSIASAKKLRKAHAVANAEFRMIDLSKPGGVDGVGADMVVCAWVLHEILPSVLDGGPASRAELLTLQAIDAMTVPGAVLVSANRFPYPGLQVPRLSERLESVGFEVIHESTIEAQEGSVTSKFPLVCFEKK